MIISELPQRKSRWMLEIYGIPDIPILSPNTPCQGMGFPHAFMGPGHPWLCAMHACDRTCTCMCRRGMRSWHVRAQQSARKIST